MSKNSTLGGDVGKAFNGSVIQNTAITVDGDVTATGASSKGISVSGSVNAGSYINS